MKPRSAAGKTAIKPVERPCENFVQVGTTAERAVDFQHGPQRRRAGWLERPAR